MDDHGLSHFRLEKDDIELELKKGTDLEAAKELLAALPSMASSHAVTPTAAPQLPSAIPVPAALGDPITSPMVGTFYTKPAPDVEAFIKVGDKVSEGQVLCIIEAMKVMNEIKAEKSGIIADICIEDGTPVQYGDELFRLK